MKILWFMFLAVIILTAGCLLLLQTTFVQTFIAGKVADALTETEIDADISFGKIHFKPFNTLIVRDLAVTDPNPCEISGETAPDTLFVAEYISARFTLKGLTGQSISIGSAFVRNARMNLVLEDGDFKTNLARMFRIPAVREKNEAQNREIFHIKNVEVENIRFCMRNATARSFAASPGGIDWNDLDVSGINVKGRHLRLTGKIMSGELDYLTFKEKSGYSVRSLSGRTRTGQGVALIEDLKLTDAWSRIDIPYFCMMYESDKDFADFIDKVRIEGIIRPSRIGMKTIGYFAPGLSGNDAVIDLNGEMHGTVSDFEIAGMNMSTENGGVSGKISGRIAGLPDIGRMTAAVRADRLSFTTESLNSLIGRWAGTTVPDMEKYAPGERFSLSGRLNGRLDDMSVRGTLSSGIGRIRARLDISGLAARGKAKSVSGTIRTNSLILDRIISDIPIRECSLEVGLRATIEKGNSSLAIDSLKVGRLHLNGYDYSGIAAAGTLSGSQFNGKVICNDPNLNFMFQGIFSFSGKTSNALYRFYANIGYADLYALNIDRRGKSRMSLQTSANFTRTSKGDMLGNVDIADVVLENGHGQYDIGDIRISSFTGNGRYRIRFSSGFAEGSYSGSAPVTSFAKDLAGVTARREIPALFEDSWAGYSGESYEFAFRTFNTMDILSFLAPGVYVADSTSIRATVDTAGFFSGRVRSGRIALNEQYIKDLDFSINNAGDILFGEIESESIYFATVMMKNNSIKLLADDNHIGAEFSYNNQDIYENRGEVVLTGDLGRSGNGGTTFDLHLLPSSVYLNSREWNIYPSDVFIDGKDITVRNIELHSGEQSILVSGGLSAEKTDTLGIGLDRFDISALNPLIGEHFALQGAVSGQARVTSPGKDRGLLLDMVSYSTSIGGERMGDLAVRSGWDGRLKRFEISAENDMDGKRSISVSGSYTPSKKFLEMDADLDMLELGYAAPFLAGIFSDIDGTVSGRFSAKGPVNDLAVTGSGARLRDAGLTVAYTNVKYIANGPFDMDEHGIYLDGISIADRAGNQGTLTGEIGYDHFRDMYFDVGINVSRIEAVNLEETESSLFYGHLSASGHVSVTGPLNAIILTADATTAGRGELHIPVSASLNAGSANLLSFKEPETAEETDPYELMVSRLKEQKKMSNDFTLRMNVSTTPEVEAFIEIDKANGNILRGRGTGTIEIESVPSEKTFNILGDYTISSGNYHFVTLGIAARDFIINDGSTIRFNGDIMDSNLNIGATYSTKASLSTLIADENSVDNRRTVNCGIQITDRLSNPRLAFSIDIPDINPAVKARVESALSSEDKVQKQFLSLLISNSFLPDEQSGIANNSSVLFSNVTDIMTNQLNNIFQKLDIPLDLGFNYQQSDQGNDIFDVAVSTQLFNNRVIVNGNIGNKESTSGNRNSDVVGDLDIEIKLDRPGAFRLNLFSHSADQYTNYLDNSQRNGIGIAYQQEFNHFGQFVKRIFMKKKDREEAELQEVRNAINEEKNYIRIETDERKRKDKKD